MAHLHAVNGHDPDATLREPIPPDLMDGLPVACGRIAGALQSLLEYPDSPAIRRIAQEAFDSYQDWYERATAPHRTES